MENVYDCYYDYKLDKFVLKNNQYGKWSALNVEQRKLIRRLLDEMDSADAIIKKQYEEKQQLISFLEDKIKEKADTIKIDKRDTVEEIEKIISGQLGELNAFQEVLDFMNKGGKDE